MLELVAVTVAAGGGAGGGPGQGGLLPHPTRGAGSVCAVEAVPARPPATEASADQAGAPLPS